MKERDAVTWNILLNAHGRSGAGTNVLSLLKEMKRTRPKWSDVTWLIVLSACRQLKLLDEGLEIFQSMLKEEDVEGKERHFNSLIHLLSLDGRLDDAEQLANEMPKADQVTWMTLLGSCRMKKDDRRAERIFGKLAQSTNEKSYTAAGMALLSNTLSAAGRHEEALEVIRKMKEQGVRKMPGQT